VNFLETPKTNSRHSKNRASIKLIVWNVLPPTLYNPAFKYSDHVISHMNDPRSKHDFNLDNLSLLKEVRRPDHLGAFESYYILKAKKEGKMLLNNDDGNVNSTLHLNLAL
jgi:hypothetical protein